ncbi:MAG: hypothetical protein OXH51_10160 [Gemmatimonadetes bacterium]|nr:hypothetical protein [Gemmatimonadota bacterium]MCY3611886.1 hypothetical protein [Gemmatimonadota bacterium]MCY3678470.1 hypothetical protein [Gemmatimonadota bacterium]MYA43678.1 hypothetical protein [Gemmatimonadota bacterium]MYE94267.1 hypothetical protein [Gemmatimonadota bacterium]
MEWEFVAPMIVSIVLILTVGGVVILRPLARRLGALLDVMVLEKSKRSGMDPGIGDAIEAMNDRLSLLEERQDFTERLIASEGSGSGGRRE